MDIYVTWDCFVPRNHIIAFIFVHLFTKRANTEAQARGDAIPRLLAMGLNIEQVAEALGLSVEEVKQHSQS